MKGVFPWCKTCVLSYRSQRRRYNFTTTIDTGRACPICLVSIAEDAHPNRVYCSDSCKSRARRMIIYGITPDEYRTLTSNKCPICNKNVKRWVIDHNHDTGETTGAVCQICNQTLLAYSYHNVEIARNLLSYLENPPIRRLFGERRYIGPDTVPQIDRQWGWGKDKYHRMGIQPPGFAPKGNDAQAADYLRRNGE